MIFFFKQKTAYEMRISDWSSDVCSSDLVQAKVTRLVGNDKEGAAYVTSYLAGDRPTPGAAADMMVHFAARGGLPSAMESSQFGYNAMTEVMNTIESVRSQKNPATDRKSTRLNSSH